MYIYTYVIVYTYIYNNMVYQCVAFPPCASMPARPPVSTPSCALPSWRVVLDNRSVVVVVVVVVAVVVLV